MMMNAVPESRIGSSLNARRSVIPSTEPGMMYGNMVSTSMNSVSALRRRVVRYATVAPRNTISRIAEVL